MKIQNWTLNTDIMTLEEVDDLVQKLREVRKRKSEAKDCKSGFDTRIANAKEVGFTFVNVDTGEVLKPEDWVVFDEINNCTYNGWTTY